MTATENMVQVFAPTDLASKRLKITNTAKGRKIQISSNLLPLFGFEKGTPVVEEPLGEGQGYKIMLAEGLPYKNTKIIYSRTYKRRKNNPFEVLFETASKKILDSTIPQYCEYIHVTIRFGVMYVKPMINNVAERIAKVMKAANPFTMFAACSSGIDAAAAQEAGFKVESLLEYRPTEKRDKRDLTETGVVSAISNVQLSHVFNEDITQVSTEYLKWATKDKPSMLFTISLQCDDFSNVKSHNLKEKSEADLSSTLDMAIDGLRIIEKLQFPMVLLEQVAPFANSEIGRMWDLRLRKMGYKTFSQKIDARDHDGLTSRVRFFHFATTLPTEFFWPEQTERNQTPIWETFIKDRIQDFRDITHTSSMKKGIETGRIRPIKEDSLHSPTPLKSQARQAADSLVIMEKDGTIRFPDEQLLKDLMGIPHSFNLNGVNKEQGTEIIGQAVDYPLYKSLIMSIKKHINDFLVKKDEFCLKSFLSAA